MEMEAPFDIHIVFIVNENEKIGFITVVKSTNPSAHIVCRFRGIPPFHSVMVCALRKFPLFFTKIAVITIIIHIYFVLVNLFL